MTTDAPDARLVASLKEFAISSHVAGEGSAPDIAATITRCLRTFVAACKDGAPWPSRVSIGDDLTIASSTIVGSWRNVEKMLITMKWPRGRPVDCTTMLPKVRLLLPHVTIHAMTPADQSTCVVEIHIL